METKFPTGCKPIAADISTNWFPPEKVLSAHTFSKKKSLLHGRNSNLRLLDRGIHHSANTTFNYSLSIEDKARK